MTSFVRIKRGVVNIISPKAVFVVLLLRTTKKTVIRSKIRKVTF